MGNVALLCLHRAMPHCSGCTAGCARAVGGGRAGHRCGMPNTTPDPSELTDLLRRQDALVTRQALTWLRESEMTSRLGRRWQVVLPGLYAAHTGPLSDRQRRRAAVLFAGGTAMLDDTTALAEYRVRYLPEDPVIRVLVDADVQRSSRDFVAIRRTIYLPRPAQSSEGLAMAPTARALTDFALRHDHERDVRAVLASAVQRRQVSVEELLAELDIAPARGRRRLVRVLEELGDGVRSAPEGDIRQLVVTSQILPKPLYNCLLQLPCGRKVSPDMLIEEAGLVHETNGRQPHAEEDDFDSMQERHDAMTACGLTVLHNSPRLIARGAKRVLHELEQCYVRDAGKGMPPGVVILRRGPA